MSVSQMSTQFGTEDQSINANRHGDLVSVYLSTGNFHRGQIELTTVQALEFAAKLTAEAGE